MLIDWFTVAAQVLNFVILVWLMKHFLYKRILNAIDKREETIAKRVADAKAEKTEAKTQQDELKLKNEEFDRERSALLEKARSEATAERERLLDAARKAADALSTTRDQERQSEAQALNAKLVSRAQEAVFKIARKTLSDLASVSLEERLCDVFTRRLRDMPSETKESLVNALTKTSEPGVVRSAFELAGREQAQVQKALNETFSTDVHVRFEVAPNVISGIELSCGGQKVAWSIQEYLASLEQGVTALVAARDSPANRSVTS